MKQILRILIILYLFIGFVLFAITFPPESFSEVIATILLWPYYLLQGFAAVSLL